MKEISKDNILELLSDEEIFRYYIPQFKKFKEKFTSVFNEDRNPSACISSWHGQLYYKDFSTNDRSLTWVGFLIKLFNFPNNNEGVKLAYNKVNIDFNLYLGSNALLNGETGLNLRKTRKKTVYIDDSPKEIFIHEKKWDNNDKLFWFDNVKISTKTLRFFKVKSILQFWIGDSLIKPNLPAYCYDEISDLDGNLKRKIYQPYNTKFKFSGNTNKDSVQGLSQLPETGDLLILDKSMKDVICLYQHLNIPAIATNSESTLPSKRLIEHLKTRFKVIIVHYDRDNGGIINAERINKEFGLPIIFFPEGSPKDNYDFIKKQGVEEFKKVFNNLIKEKMNE
jgi:hypothetical protein